MSRVIAAAVIACALLVSFGESKAQEYPNRSITLVLGLAVGGAVDIQSRMFADAAAEKLGQPIIVENRGGGGGIPAALSVKRAAPDGYTLMVLLGGHAIATQPLPFDLINDFEPIIPLYSQPGFVVVPKDRNVRSLQELIAFGKKKPEGLTYGSPSNGSPGHIMGALFEEATGVKMTHIPYRGGAQVITDLVGGRLDVAFTTYTNFSPHLANGSLVSLAIAQSSRWSEMPDVPTLSELGHPNIDVDNLFGIAAPKGIAPEVVRKLNSAFMAASREPQLSKKLGELGAVVITSSRPNDLTDALQRDAVRFAPIVQKLSAK